MQQNTAVGTGTKFDLKHEVVELIPAAPLPTPHTFVSVEELEASRLSTPFTASKHGLEAICGASCDTGAM